MAANDVTMGTRIISSGLANLATPRRSQSALHLVAGQLARRRTQPHELAWSRKPGIGHHNRLSRPPLLEFRARRIGLMLSDPSRKTRRNPEAVDPDGDDAQQEPQQPLPEQPPSRASEYASTKVPVVGRQCRSVDSHWRQPRGAERRPPPRSWLVLTVVDRCGSRGPGLE